MLTAIKNKQSLSFHETYNPVIYSPKNVNLNQELSMVVFPLANNTVKAGIVTVKFNKECNGYIKALTAKRYELNRLVSENLKSDPSYQGARHKGVKLAWEYEKYDVAMGGKGSANWSAEERQEIPEHGKVRQKSVADDAGNVKQDGPEGHHIKNVNDHPEEQANPDNIKFYKNKEEHLNEGHDGDFRNSSDGDLINKNKMLKRTNFKRVIKNELLSAGISAVIGFGVGFTLSFVTELACAGLSTENVSAALWSSAKSGLEAGVLAFGLYGVGRLCSFGLEKMGVDILSASGQLINMGAIGLLSVAATCVYQCIKLKIHGELNKNTLVQIGKQAAFSVSVIAVSIIAQGIWGGYAGVIVSSAIGLIYISINIGRSIHERKIAEKIRQYSIEQYKRCVLGGT